MKIGTKVKGSLPRIFFRDDSSEQFFLTNSEIEQSINPDFISVQKVLIKKPIDLTMIQYIL